MTTRVHYPARVLPDTVVECPGTEVTVVGYAVGPVGSESMAILVKSRVKGRCPR